MNVRTVNAKELGIQEVIRAVRRRKVVALAVFIGLLVASCILAYALPPVFRSSATVLIEQQEIPQDLVRSTVTSFADQRIQVIIQRAMTFSKLSELIKKYDLYSEMKDEAPLEQIVEKMKKDIDHQMISAEVVDPRSGRPVEATIAFSVAYVSRDPQTSQRIANEIVSIFLEENLKNRTEMAEEAESFLGEELRKIGAQNSELEAEIATFKEKHMKSLPEQIPFNRNLLDRYGRELEDVLVRIRTAEERRAYLSAQISQVEPYSRVVGDANNAVMTTEERARFLQNKYLSLSAVYSKDHPDVVKTKRELDELAAGMSGWIDRRFLEKQIKILQDERAALEQQYSVEHPDVKVLSAKIDRYSQLARSLPEDVGARGAKDSDNPAYLQLTASYEGAGIELRHLKKRQQDLSDKIAELESELISAPQIEKEYMELTRKLENNVVKYRTLKAKHSEAQMAKSLESERKSERFTLIEPPMIPERPVKPNRKLILFLGVLLSAGFALGSVLLLEKIDPTIRGYKAVSAATGYSPLAVIPHIVIREELEARAKHMKVGVISLGVMVVAVVAAAHFMFMPLDVFWFVLLRKFS